MGMNRKGIYYTLDAIVFAMLLIGAITLLPSQQTAPVRANSAAYIAHDLIGVLEELRVDEVNMTWSARQLADGNISRRNMTLTNQLGELWSKGEYGLAYDLARQTLGNVTAEHIGHGIWINDEILYTTTHPVTAHAASGWRVASGLEKDRPLRGFVASARAAQVRGNSTKIISISPEGAGWDDGYVEITKHFNMTGATILDARMILSVHADTNDADVRIDFNDGMCSYDRSDFSWLFGTEGNIGTKTVTACVQEGLNNFTLHLNNDGYNAHTHPGMYLQINYTAESSLDPRSVHVSRRFYFDNVRSVESGWDGAGVWASQPFHIPQEARNINTALRVVGKNVRDYGGFNWFYSWDGWRRMRDADYALFVNSQTPMDTDSHPPSDPVYAYDAGELRPHLVNGTNIISVYFNTYGDYVWGDDWVEIYSRPYEDPEGSSYVELNYTLPAGVEYGMIDVGQVKVFDGPLDEDKTQSFQFPEEALMKGEVYLHAAQRYSFMVTAWADTVNPPGEQVFRSPASRAVPTSIFIDNSNVGLSHAIQNYIRVRDDNNGNEIVPSVTSIEYHFYIPSYVGYGQVFSTESGALQDALDRLEEEVGGYLSLSGIDTDLDSITQVPSLWGPAVVEVRAWD